MGPFEKRRILEGYLENNEFIITNSNNTVYSFPNNKKDSLTSSCIGKYVKAEFKELDWNNKFKGFIIKYSKTQ